jgi:hypothetical protein
MEIFGEFWLAAGEVRIGNLGQAKVGHRMSSGTIIHLPGVKHRGYGFQARSRSLSSGRPKAGPIGSRPGMTIGKLFGDERGVAKSPGHKVLVAPSRQSTR